MKVKFTKYKCGPDGQPLYRLHIDGEPVQEGLTIDQVVEAINRRDEEELGCLHAGRLP